MFKLGAASGLTSKKLQALKKRDAASWFYSNPDLIREELSKYTADLS